MKILYEPVAVRYIKALVPIGSRIPRQAIGEIREGGTRTYQVEISDVKMMLQNELRAPVRSKKQIYKEKKQ